MRNIAANVFSILIVFGILILVAIGYAKHEFTAPGPLEKPVVVQLPKGANLSDTARLLNLYGAIDSQMIFRLGARYMHQERAIKAGEYEIPPHASMTEILAMLVQGKSIQHKVTIAEGLTSYEIVQIVKDNQVLTGDIPELPPEGSLAPDTYFVQRGQTREELLKRMTESQTQRLDKAWANRAAGLPLKTPEDALILASIVEKETGLPGERPRVAAVFINRLKRGMRLQSDPTVVYGLTHGKGSLGRGLRRSELDGATPYNTYQIDGLPPTPICSPGLASIEAVLNPASTNDLYFVADGSGGHVFSSTLAEHNRNVAKWRKLEQQRNQSQ